MVRNAQRRAFTMVELLISLAITALLLASVAVGAHAYLKSYKDNECIVSLTGTSRLVLSQMMVEARAAGICRPPRADLRRTPQNF